MSDIKITEQIKESITKSVLCWLATISLDGSPNVSPKEIFTWYGDNQLLIANIASPQSVSNILANERVCVSFIDVFVQKGYQLKGTAAIINKDNSIFKDLITPLIPIAGPLFPIHSIIQIHINHVKAILAPRYFLYPDTTEQAQIDSAMKRYKVKAVSV